MTRFTLRLEGQIQDIWEFAPDLNEISHRFWWSVIWAEFRMLKVNAEDLLEVTLTLDRGADLPLHIWTN